MIVTPVARWALVAFVVIAAATLLILAGDIWRFTADSGIYVGTAIEMAEKHRYWFNGQPNLLYFPGFSTLLALLIALFGVNFFILNLFNALLVAIALYCCYRYYNAERWGLSGYLLPLLLFANPLVHERAFKLLSDGLLLAIVAAVLLLWQRYLERRSPALLFTIAALATYAPLVRMEGAFLTAAFILAYLIDEYRRGRSFTGAFGRTFLLGAVVSTPFVLWAARNYLNYTPETYNQFNKLFFGQQSLMLYPPKSLQQDWIDAAWQYPVYNALHLLDALVDSLIGKRLGHKIPAPVGVAALIGVAAFGIRHWLRRATALEIVFAVTMFVFLMAWQTRSTGTYNVVPRYWTPLMPTILMLLLCGSCDIYQRLRTKFLRRSGMAVCLLTGLVVAVNGVSSYIDIVQSRVAYAAGTEAIKAAVAVIDSESGSDVVVATTDWGVVPLYLNRPSVMAMSDPGHFYTVDRLVQKDAGYLIVVDELTKRSSVPARHMVRTNRAAFIKIFERKTPRGRYYTTLYRIDRDRLRDIWRQGPGSRPRYQWR